MPTGIDVPRPPVLAADATIKAQAATGNLAVADFQKINTNTGAGAGIVLTLPAAALVAGKACKIHVTVAQTVTLSPAATDAVYLGGSGVDDKDLVIAGVIGNYCDLYSNGENYLVLGYSGVVTKQA